MYYFRSEQALILFCFAHVYILAERGGGELAMAGMCMHIYKPQLYILNLFHNNIYRSKPMC